MPVVNYQKDLRTTRIVGPKFRDYSAYSPVCDVFVPTTCDLNALYWLGGDARAYTESYLFVTLFNRLYLDTPQFYILLGAQERGPFFFGS